MPVKAEVKSKKVQTNYQYKLVCGYHNGSNELTWGSQENIGDFYNDDGSESNSNRACGETFTTRNYPIGDPYKNNLPANVEMIYDNCNGSTGKQIARAGQSCSNPGKVRTCTVKWTGYCYQDTTKKKTTKKTYTSKRFTLTDSFIKVGQTTEIKQTGICQSFAVEDKDILSYDDETLSFTALKEGKTNIVCYDENNEIYMRKAVRVKGKAKTKTTTVRYVTETTDTYTNANHLHNKDTLEKGSKVKYMNVKVNGYCKIKYENENQFISCDELSIEKVL